MIGVSLVSAVNTQTKEKQKELEKIDSPLFKIRTKNAIKEETPIKNKIKDIITNFLENRVFLLKEVLINFMKSNLKDSDESYHTTEPIELCTEGKLCANSIGIETYHCGTCDVNGNCAETCINVCGKDQQPD